MFTCGAGAVIFPLVRGRILAMCFGHVHIPLNDGAFERQFGLKVGHNGLSIEGLVPATRVTIEYPLVSGGTCANGIDYAPNRLLLD